jgi:hypothetical protein
VDIEPKIRLLLSSDDIGLNKLTKPPEAITEEMNRVCAEVDSHPDPAWSALAHRVLERSEW